MEEGLESTQKVSKYNSAVAQLMRIDRLWQDCHTHSRSGKYKQWNTDLDKVWSELAGDIKPDSPHEKTFSEFQKKLAQIGIFTNPAAAFDFTSDLDKGKMAMQYVVLLSKEIWLRRLQNEQGKGTAYADPYEDDFD